VLSVVVIVFARPPTMMEDLFRCNRHALRVLIIMSKLRNQNDLYAPTAQVAQMLNHGKRKARMLIIAGQLQSIKNGRSPRILPGAVEGRGRLCGIVSLYLAWTIDEWLTELRPHAEAFRLLECHWLVDRLVAADNRRLARPTRVCTSRIGDGASDCRRKLTSCASRYFSGPSAYGQQ
jgi:hypothetical protein